MICVCRGKVYETLNQIGSRITYLKNRKRLKPTEQEELAYLDYALSEKVRAGTARNPLNVDNWRQIYRQA